MADPDSCKLVNKKCKPCEGGIQPLSSSESQTFLKEMNQWSLLEDKKIQKDYKFKNFKEAMNFVNKISEIAEEEGHHPDIYLHNWNKVTVTLSTHSIGGLSENDFIVAAKIDYSRYKNDI